MTADRKHTPLCCRTMNLGGTIRLNRAAIGCIVAICILLFVYYVSVNHNVRGSVVNSVKTGLHFSSGQVDLERLLAVAIEVAERGGREVRQVRKEAALDVQSKGKTREGVLDPLTLGDLRSHLQMYNGIKQTFPEINVISEERTGKLADEPISSVVQPRDQGLEGLLGGAPVFVDAADITVWIDPLDATKEYTENLLHYVTTMVCVAVKGLPTIGVIHQPFNGTGVTYWAWLGRGHSRTLLPVAKPATPPSPVKVLVSRSHAGATEDLAFHAFGAIKKVTAAGAGYKSLSLVSGAGDVYLHATLIKKWDTCAPTAVLATLGGATSTLAGQLIDYSGTEVDKREKVEHGLLATLHYHDKYAADLRRVQPAARR